MTVPRNWSVALAIGLAAATLSLGLAEMAALFGQTGPFMWSPLVGAARGHDLAAYRNLEHGLTAPALTAAAMESRRALALSPYDNEARLRLAYIESIQRPPPGPAGVAMVEQSYALVPFDYTVATWRIRFALEHWGALSPTVRNEVYEEAMAFAGSGSRDVSIRPALQSIHDPQGRLAAALWLQLLNH